MKQNGSKKNNSQSSGNQKTPQRIWWALLFASNLLALGFLIWSVWPIPVETFTVPLPQTYWSPTEKATYQFSYERQLSLNFPAYLRYGDTQNMQAILSVVADNERSEKEDCRDFCTLKHPVAENVWQRYDLNILFSFELNNLIMLPPGDTRIKLSQTDSQQFAWQIQAAKNAPAYMKNTIFMEYLPKNDGNNNLELIFAKELSIPVHSVGLFSFPILRIFTIIWLLCSSFFVFLNWKWHKTIQQKADEGMGITTQIME